MQTESNEGMRTRFFLIALSSPVLLYDFSRPIQLIPKYITELEVQG